MKKLRKNFATNHNVVEAMGNCMNCACYCYQDCTDIFNYVADSTMHTEMEDRSSYTVAFGDD